MVRPRDVSRLPRAAINRARLMLKRVGRALYRRVSPAEREFRRIWPAIDSIEGLLVSPMQERWLFKAARSLRDQAIILEIGSFKGRSTCCLAYGCRGTGKHVFAIDTFEGNEADFFQRGFFDEFSRNIEACGLTEYVTPLTGRSDEVAKLWERPIDLLFIDGSHRYEDVLTDFRNFFDWVIPGGVLALHDVGDGRGWPGPYRAWHGDIKSQLMDIGSCDTLAFGRKPK